MIQHSHFQAGEINGRASELLRYGLLAYTKLAGLGIRTTFPLRRNIFLWCASEFFLSRGHKEEMKDITCVRKNQASALAYYRRTMDNLAEPPRGLLRWTVCAYKRPDLSEEYYHGSMSQVHGPLVKDLMVK